MKTNNLPNRTTVELPDRDDYVWEFFHENSKVEKHRPFLSNEDIVRNMQEQHDSMYYPSRKVFYLDDVDQIELGALKESIKNRESGREWPATTELTFQDLSTILTYGYGVSSERFTVGVREPRVIPSGGGLYPLDIYISARNVIGLEQGLYHYNPNMVGLQQLKKGDQILNYSSSFIQRNIAESSAAMLFITAFFKRSTFKYGPRGYRFCMIEAGHIAQNINLISAAQKNLCLNIGGYYDSEIDGFLDLNGLDQSVIYCIALGKEPL